MACIINGILSKEGFRNGAGVLLLLVIICVYYSLREYSE